MIGILTAVREELKPILRKMPSVDTESAGGILFHRGRISGVDVVVARSGMGEQRARAAARTLIERYRPDSILALGFAGGLSKQALPGDLIIASEVGESVSPDASLLAAAEQTRLDSVRIHIGPLHSAGSIVYTVEEKRALADRYPDSMAVDMESAGVASEAAALGIPWLAVRAITDGSDDALPELVEPFRGLAAIDTETGDVLPLRMALMVIFRPLLIRKLIQLGGRASIAARNLANFVESYMARLPEAGRDSTGA